MPGHDVKHLEDLLRGIQAGTDEMLTIIYKKGYTTPREFALSLGQVEGIAAQLKSLVVVSREIVAGH